MHSALLSSYTTCRVRRADLPELCDRTHRLGDMLNINIAPLVFQILSDEATVTMMWLFFTAQQTAAVQQFARRRIFDLPGADQVKKLPLVQWPVSVLGFLVCIENIRRGGELGKMHVFDVADCSCEIPKIVLFREACKL